MNAVILFAYANSQYASGVQYELASMAAESFIVNMGNETFFDSVNSWVLNVGLLPIET